MHVTRRMLLLALLAVTGWFAWTHVVEQMEIVTLFARGPSEDHYTRLWIVDGHEHTWVRAERPDRIWLEAVRANPNVTLWRDGRSEHMRAVVWNGNGATDHVDRLFRAKYGVLDAIAGFLWRRDSVPIRLERR